MLPEVYCRKATSPASRAGAVSGLPRARSPSTVSTARRLATYERGKVARTRASGTVTSNSAPALARISA